MLVALLSVAILGTTGVAWAKLYGPGGGLTTSDVIGSGFKAPDGAMDVLLVGNDSRTDAQGNPLPQEVLEELRTTAESGDLTDTMILVRIPNSGERASAVSFPRDTLVNLGNGYGEQKLNSALSRAKQDEMARLSAEGVTDQKELEQKSTAAGQAFLIQTIERFSDVSIDHYAEVNLLGFSEITKAIGGVDVCLKQPVDDSDHSGAVFPAGPQKIQGADALAFVRQRYGLPRGDLDRVVRQQVFISGLMRNMMDSGVLGNPAKLNDLYNAVKKSLVLDEGWDPISFMQQMKGIASGDIEFNTIPVHLIGESGEEDVVAYEPEVQRFVKNILLPPDQRKAKQKQQQAQAAQRSGTTVDVYNTTGATGLAGRVLENLTSEGFGEGAADTAEPMATSVIRHAPGEKAIAEQVSNLLGGVPTEVGEGIPAGSVEVYLGDDYAGPGAQNFAGGKTIRLDGLQQATPLPAQQPDAPITADGVPCVY